MVPRLTIRILHADAHRLFRQALKNLLDSRPGFEVSIDAGDRETLLRLLPGQGWDVLLLDVNLSDSDGLSLIRQIRTATDRPVLLLTAHPECEYGLRAFRAGADGFLSKDSDQSELVRALEIVAQKRKFLTSSLAEKIAASLASGATGEVHETLSEREYQVFRLLVSGKPVRDIAATLHLSVKTVSTYRTRLLGKMGVRSNAELVQYAMRRGLHFD